MPPRNTRALISQRDESPESSDAEADAAFEREVLAGCHKVLSSLSAISSAVPSPHWTPTSTSALTDVTTLLDAASEPLRRLLKHLRTGATRDLEPLWHDPRLYHCVAAAVAAGWRRHATAVRLVDAERTAARDAELAARARAREQQRLHRATASSALAAPLSQPGSVSAPASAAAAIAAAQARDPLRAPAWVPPGVRVATVSDYGRSASSGSGTAGACGDQAGLACASSGSLAEIRRRREAAQSEAHAQAASRSDETGDSLLSLATGAAAAANDASAAPAFTPAFVPATPGLLPVSSSLAGVAASKVAGPTGAERALESAVAQLLQCYTLLLYTVTPPPPPHQRDEGGSVDQDDEDMDEDGDEGEDGGDTNPEAGSVRSLASLDRGIFLNAARRAGVSSASAAALAPSIAGGSVAPLTRRLRVQALDATYAAWREGYLDPRAAAGVGLYSTCALPGVADTADSAATGFAAAPAAAAPAAHSRVTVVHGTTALLTLPFIAALVGRLGAGLFVPFTVADPLTCDLTADALTPASKGSISHAQPFTLTLTRAPDVREAAPVLGILRQLYLSCPPARAPLRRAVADALAVFALRAGAAPALTPASAAADAHPQALTRVLASGALRAPALWAWAQPAVAASPVTGAAAGPAAPAPGLLLLQLLLRGTSGIAAAGTGAGGGSAYLKDSLYEYRCPSLRTAADGGAVAAGAGATAVAVAGSAVSVSLSGLRRALASAGALRGEAGGVGEALTLLSAIVAGTLLAGDTDSASGGDVVSGGAALPPRARLHMRLLLTVIAELWAADDHHAGAPLASSAGRQALTHADITGGRIAAAVPAAGPALRMFETLNATFCKDAAAAAGRVTVPRASSDGGAGIAEDECEGDEGNGISGTRRLSAAPPPPHTPVVTAAAPPGTHAYAPRVPSRFSQAAVSHVGSAGVGGPGDAATAAAVARRRALAAASTSAGPTPSPASASAGPLGASSAHGRVGALGLPTSHSHAAPLRASLLHAAPSASTPLAGPLSGPHLTSTGTGPGFGGGGGLNLRAGPLGGPPLAGTAASLAAAAVPAAAGVALSSGASVGAGAGAGAGGATECLLSVYQEPLIRLALAFVNADPAFLPPLLTHVATCYPAVRAANSPKALIILHHVEALLLAAHTPAVRAVAVAAARRPLWALLSDALTSEHSSTSQRALEMLKHAEIRALFFGPAASAGELLSSVAPTLVRTLAGSKHWSESVNRRRGAALRAFCTDAHSRWLGNACAASAQAPGEREVSYDDDDGVAAAFAAVAPSTASSAAAGAHAPRCGACGGRTVPDTPAARAFAQACAAALGVSVDSAAAQQCPTCTTTGEGTSTDAGAAAWLPPNLVSAFCAALQRARVLAPPETADEAQDPLVERAKTEAVIPRALPPSLRYLDLIFGPVLGSGSFAAVLSAQHVVRGRLPSRWLTVAVKAVDRALVRASAHARVTAAREIVALRLFHHPAVTRLLGACETQRTVFLVLEFAKNHDLHAAVTAAGPCVAPSAANSAETAAAVDAAEVSAAAVAGLRARVNSPVTHAFLAGELLGALAHVHGHGFVYGDMKLENALIHESGHVKIADFGTTHAYAPLLTLAADPSVEAGADAVADARTRAALAAAVGASAGVVEGTAEYLAPELALAVLHAAKDDRKNARRAGRPRRARAAGVSSVSFGDARTGATPSAVSPWQHLRRALLSTGPDTSAAADSGATPAAAHARAAGSSPSSDLWAFGCVLYAVLAGGRTPTERDTGSTDSDDDDDDGDDDEDDDDSASDSDGSVTGGDDAGHDQDEPEPAEVKPPAADALRAPDALPVRTARGRARRREPSSSSSSSTAAVGTATDVSGYRAASRSRSVSVSRSRSRRRRAEAAAAATGGSAFGRDDPFTVAQRAVQRVLRRVRALARRCATGSNAAAGATAATVTVGSERRVAGGVRFAPGVRRAMGRHVGFTVASDAAGADADIGARAGAGEGTSGEMCAMAGAHGAAAPVAPIAATEVSPLPAAAAADAAAFVAALLAADPRRRLGVTRLDLESKHTYLHRWQEQQQQYERAAADATAVGGGAEAQVSVVTLGVSPLFTLPRRDRGDAAILPGTNADTDAAAGSGAAVRVVTPDLATACGPALRHALTGSSSADLSAVSAESVGAETSADLAAALAGGRLTVRSDCELYYVDYDAIAAHPYLEKYLQPPYIALADPGSDSSAVGAGVRTLHRCLAPIGLRDPVAAAAAAASVDAGAGADAAAGGKAWQRRKNSMMWAPMPPALNLSQAAASALPPLPADDIADLAAAAEADAAALVHTAAADVSAADGGAAWAVRRAGDAAWLWHADAEPRGQQLFQKQQQQHHQQHQQNQGWGREGSVLGAEAALWRWLERSP